jgi:hypothetical protein
MEVTCATSGQALFKSQATEDIDFNFGFLIGDCRFEKVEVRPAGALGRSVALVLGLQQRLERSLEKKVNAFCK